MTDLPALRKQVKLAKIWLAERDRYYRADAPETPASVLIRFEQKVTAAREAFRKAIKDKDIK